MNLIRRDSCESCDQRETVRSHDYYQPDETVCGLTGTDDFDCERVQSVEKLVAVAEKVAAVIATIDDTVMRKEVAASTSDGLANALYEGDESADFDTLAFCELVEKFALRASVEVRP